MFGRLIGVVLVAIVVATSILHASAAPTSELSVQPINDSIYLAAKSCLGKEHIMFDYYPYVRIYRFPTDQ